MQGSRRGPKVGDDAFSLSSPYVINALHFKMQSLFCDRLVWAELWVTFYHHENVVRCDDDLVELCRRVNSFLEMYNALENVKA
jgi:hypothetical protein